MVLARGPGAKRMAGKEAADRRSGFIPVRRNQG